MDNGDIGRYAKLRRAILDKNVRIPQNATVGHDLDRHIRHRPRIQRCTGGGDACVSLVRRPYDGALSAGVGLRLSALGSDRRNGR